MNLTKKNNLLVPFTMGLGSSLQKISQVLVSCEFVKNQMINSSPVKKNQLLRSETKPKSGIEYTNYLLNNQGFSFRFFPSNLCKIKEIILLLNRNDPPFNYILISPGINNLSLLP